MKRDSFIRYESFSNAIALLPVENQLDAYRFIVQYGLTGELPEQSIDPIAYAVFILAKQQLEINNKRYLSGCKGGRPKSKWNKSVKEIVT